MFQIAAALTSAALFGDGIGSDWVATSETVPIWSCICFWQILCKLKQNSEHEGKKLEENTAKLKEQKLILEKELRDQREKLEEAVAKVRLAEENNRKLEKEASQLAALEETVRKSSKICHTSLSLQCVGAKSSETNQ